MRYSFFFKLFSCFFLIILLLTISFLFFSFNSIRRHYIDTLAGNLENLGISLEPQIISFLEDSRHAELDTYVKNLGEKINTRITVVDQEGLVLADSDEDPEQMVNHRFRPEIAEAFEGSVGRSLRFSNTVKADMLYVGIPVERQGEITDVLRVSLYLQDINLLLSDLRKLILRIVLIITGLSLLGAYIVSRKMTKPLKDISEASRQIASGDFSPRIFVKAKDEFGELALSFNLMTEKTETLFAELEQQKEELDKIISSIDEGIVAIDKEGKILFGNKSFCKTVQADQVKDKFYWEIVRKPQFDDLMKKVQEKGEDYVEEMTFNGNIMLCRAHYLDSREEILVTFYDLTKIKNIEQIKKDLVVNVSHELRTPLTVVKGYVETLAENARKEDLSYINSIKRNTDRLINIVKDLLTLAQVEEKDIITEYKNVDLESLLNTVLEMFDQKIKEKGLETQITAEENIPPVKGDEFRLEQMFINIIDNAVKYTEKGKVFVQLKKHDKGVMVEIEDTGIGIPESDLSRIFERFYVVDKSRSREQEGTGLGLSIVKHIVLLHKGQISVESTEGKGTKFIIFFPS